MLYRDVLLEFNFFKRKFKPNIDQDKLNSSIILQYSLFNEIREKFIKSGIYIDDDKYDINTIRQSVISDRLKETDTKFHIDDVSSSKYRTIFNVISSVLKSKKFSNSDSVKNFDVVSTEFYCKDGDYDGISVYIEYYKDDDSIEIEIYINESSYKNEASVLIKTKKVKEDTLVISSNDISKVKADIIKLNKMIADAIDNNASFYNTEDNHFKSEEFFEKGLYRNGKTYKSPWAYTTVPVSYGNADDIREAVEYVLKKCKFKDRNPGPNYGYNTIVASNSTLYPYIKVTYDIFNEKLVEDFPYIRIDIELESKYIQIM